MARFELCYIASHETTLSTLCYAYLPTSQHASRRSRPPLRRPRRDLRSHLHDRYIPCENAAPPHLATLHYHRAPRDAILTRLP